jgi:hypothetical protein
MASFAFRLAGIVVLMLATVTVNPPFAPAQGVNDILAVTGDAAPGGGAYLEFDVPKVNDHGQVAIDAVTGLNFDHGIFRAERGVPMLSIVRSGQSAAGNGTFEVLGFTDINNAGQMLFWSDLAGTSGGNADNRGLYLGAGGPVAQLVREGAPLTVNGLFGTRFGHTLQSLDYLPFTEGPVLNDAGQVVITGNVQAFEPAIGGATAVNFNAGMRVNPNGTVNIAFESAGAAPLAGGGSSGTIDQFVGLPILVDHTMMINDAGHAAFRATTTGPGGEGIFWSNVADFPGQNQRRAVGRNGQTLIPGASGAMQVSFGSPFITRVHVAMNDVGEMAFIPLLNPAAGGNPPDFAIYRWSPIHAAQPGAHGLTEIARLGTPSPDGDGVLGLISPSDVQINNQGQAVFQATINNSSFGAGDNGIFRGDGQTLSVIARRGDATPDGQLFFGTSSQTISFGLGLNDSGQVAFMASLRDANDQFAGHGMYLSDGVETVEITRVGRSLAGSTVEGLAWTDRRSLNELGQVAYVANLADGRDAVVLYTLEDIHWRTPGDGLWDENTNWTLSTTPGQVHHITIDPSVAASIVGPASDVSVRSLTVGAAGASVEHALMLKAAATITVADSIAIHENAAVGFTLGGTASYPRLATSGAATLDGELIVFLESGFAPSAGDAFDLMDWSSVSGSFDHLDLPALAADLAWATSQLDSIGLLSVTFAADFDEDGDVDGDDLANWKSGYGAANLATHVQGDANGDRNVDGADFLLWQRQFGSASAVAAAQPAAGAVPEPSGAALVLIAAGLIARRRAHRSA